MLGREKVHLVPQSVVDCYEGAMANKNNKTLQDNYIMRLEAIRDYCIAALMFFERKKK